MAKIISHASCNLKSSINWYGVMLYFFLKVLIAWFLDGADILAMSNFPFNGSVPAML